MISDRIFEDAGVLGDIEIGELPLHFIPLAEDVLSLELEDSFRDLFLVCYSVQIRLDIKD